MAADPPSSDQLGRLASARAGFVANLGRRLDTLNTALAELRAEPDSKSRLNNLLRRIHALSAAARVLGFGGMAEALSRTEATLHAALELGDVADGVLDEVERLLGGLPGMIWGGPERPEAGADRRWPLNVLVAAPLALKEALEQGSDAGTLELEYAESLEHAHELARIVGPDVLVLDADIPGAAALLERLHDDEMVLPLRSVVVGSFDAPEAATAYVKGGATKVLAKPVPPDALRGAVAELSTQRRQVSLPSAGLGALTVDMLAERIGSEIRRGLVDAAEGASHRSVVDLGDGTDVLAAVWGAVARVRELVTARSGGTVRFTPDGPEGAVPLAAWSGPERRAGERTGRAARSVEDVSLAGRKVLVADDDPAVVWFISSLLRAAGAQVIEAHDGQTALDLTFALWPDVVVSDVLMPQLDGFSLCREIKRDVAVRDVPVVLLSWKEDLLQRVRELGADADGYLRKEATGSTVVERIREVLRPRARVEARLAAGGEVRGRLDGLTPRLILQLACAAGGNVKVSIRDAAYLYIVQIRGGRPQTASRTAVDGKHEAGPRALASLLGASAGRFVVLPDSAACDAELNGDLSEVLREPIDRARAAQFTLGPDQVGRACSIGIDRALIAGYLAVTPEPAKSLMVRLAQGDSPRELLLIGDISARLLELVLGDLARHGAVQSVQDIQGKDLLPEAFELLARRSRAASGMLNSALRAPPPHAVPPAIVAPPSPPAPEQRVVLSDGAERDLWEPVRVATVSPDWPMNPDVTPLVAGAAEPAFKPEEPGTMPGIGEQAEVEPKPLPEAAEKEPPLEAPVALPVAAILPANDAAPREPTPALDVARVEARDSAPSEPAPVPVRKIELPSSSPPVANDPPAPAKPEARPEATSEGEQLTPRPTTAQAAPSDARWGWLRFGLATAAAGVVSFFVMRSVLGPSASRVEPAEPPVPAASPAPASVTITPEDHELPPDAALPAGKALLEVETGGAQAIYVDNEFIGHGPRQRVALDAGQHEVRTTEGERERTDTVTLKPGRLLRLPLAPAWPAAAPAGP